MGILRFVLALFVVTQHLAGFRYLGASAVHVFFLISGYLMTRVMLETYGYSIQGFSQFWKNRILRLGPAYLVVVAVSVFVLMLTGEDFAKRFVTSIGIPTTLAGWTQNLTMIFADIMPFSVQPRIVPPTWALTLELACYFLISLGITRSKKLAWIWFGAGALYLVCVIIAPGYSRWAYASIPAAFLPFAIGSLIFHEERSGGGLIFQTYHKIANRMTLSNRMRLSPEFAIILTCLGMIVVLVLVRFSVANILELKRLGMLVFLLNILPGTLALLAALHWVPQTSSIRSIDRIAGELSYPIYIAHFCIGIFMAWVWQALGGANLERGPILLGLTLLPLLLFSLTLIRFVDTPISRLRDKVRATARAQNDSIG